MSGFGDLSEEERERLIEWLEEENKKDRETVRRLEEQLEEIYSQIGELNRTLYVKSRGKYELRELDGIIAYVDKESGEPVPVSVVRDYIKRLHQGLEEI